MKIQSLSVVVPTKTCINNCKFCVAHMHEEPYVDQLGGNRRFFDLYQRDFIKRLEFARDNGCNTAMLTGNGEPQQNMSFLMTFGTLNAQLSKPFRKIEMQTTGTLIDGEMLRPLRNHVGVTTISLSINSFDNAINASTCRMRNPVDIKWLCSEIKRYDFNLRLSINLTREFESKSPEEIMLYAHDNLGADQVTFRVLYTSGEDTEQDRWIAENGASPEFIQELKDYVLAHGRPLGKLEYGGTKYSLHSMSTVVDDDCMAQAVKEEYKYLILRPNCKLYSKWDDPASLIF